MRNLVGKWLLNLGVSLDQLVNTVFGGNPDETISSRIGKVRLANGGVVPWRNPIMKLIDYACDLVDKDHTLESIENGIHGKRSIENAEKDKAVEKNQQ